MNNLVKVWYEPKNGYKLFDKDGKEIQGVMKVTVSDNWDGSKTSTPTAVIEIACEVVNERPEAKTDGSAEI